MSEPIKLVTRPQRRNAEAVDVMKKFAALVNSGKLESIAITGVFHDGSLYTDWTGTDKMSSLMGAVSLLQHRLIDERPRHDSDR